MLNSYANSSSTSNLGTLPPFFGSDRTGHASLSKCKARIVNLQMPETQIFQTCYLSSGRHNNGGVGRPNFWPNIKPQSSELRVNCEKKKLNWKFRPGAHCVGVGKLAWRTFALQLAIVAAVSFCDGLLARNASPALSYPTEKTHPILARRKGCINLEAPRKRSATIKTPNLSLTLSSAQLTYHYGPPR